MHVVEEWEKPRIYKDVKSRLWKCQLGFVAGQGTTPRGAWDDLWGRLGQDPPVVTKPKGDENLPALTWPPSGLFKHTDGGLYEVLYGALLSTDQSNVVGYKHRWPFKEEVRTCPHSEWLERFTPISQQQYDEIVLSTDRKVAQQLITQRRVARKAKATLKYPCGTAAEKDREESLGTQCGDQAVIRDRAVTVQPYRGL